MILNSELSGRIELPWPLRLHWAWLVVAYVAEYAIRMVLVHYFGWRAISLLLPAWFLLQTWWLFRAYPANTALYWNIAHIFFEVLEHSMVSLFWWYFALSQLCRIASLLAFQFDLKNLVQKRALELRLNMWFTVLFNSFYIQYKLNKLGESQRLQMSSVMPAAT